MKLLIKNKGFSSKFNQYHWFYLEINNKLDYKTLICFINNVVIIKR